MEVFMNSSFFKDDLVVIVPSYMKKKLIEENKLKYNIKYIDEYELRDKYLYKYRDDTCVYLDKKYHMIPEVSNIVLNYLYEIDITKSYSSHRLNNLVVLKKDLIDNKYSEI